MVNNNQSIELSRKIDAESLRKHKIVGDAQENPANQGEHAAFFEHASLAVAYMSLDCYWLQMSPAFCRLVGYSCAELRQLTLRDLASGAEVDQELACLYRLLTGEVPAVRVEKQYQRKDKALVWVVITISVVRDEGDHPACFLVFLEDISECKVMQEDYKRLGMQREQIEQIDEYTQILQAITDTELVHLTLDALFQALLSRIRQILKADNIAILLLTEDGQSLTVRAANGLEETVAGDVRIPLGRGFAGRIAAQCQPLSVTDDATVEILTPILREQLHSLLGVPLLVNGKVTGVVHIGMKRSYHFTQKDVQLLQRVAGRLALAIERAILNEAAQRAHQEAIERAAQLEQMSRLQNNFLAIVSHEFRTTLTVIQGFSDILRSYDCAQEVELVREYAEDIYVDALRLVRMVTDLLDLEQMKEGKMALQMQSLDLNAILQNEVERTQVWERHHRIIMDLDTLLPKVNADPDKIRQVITNLLSNALKYSPEETEIRIISRKEGWQAHLRVQDQGRGIPQEALMEVFHPYNRIHANKTRYIQGTGLGLAIVHEIVSLHQGKVWVESVPGHGSVFHVMLPLSVA